jgi:PAS domain S-box-containing protein
VQASTPSAGPLPRAARRYLTLWYAAGIAVLTAGIVRHPPTLDQLDSVQQIGHPLAALALFVAINALGGGVAVPLLAGAQRRSVTLIEASVIATLLVVPGSWALISIAAGIVIGETCIRRMPFVKTAFNAAMYTVASASAWIVADLVRGSTDRFSIWGIVALLLAMVVFGVVNLAALGGIVTRVAGSTSQSSIRHAHQLLRMSLLGNTAVGVLGAVVIESSHPHLVALLAVPVATLWLTYNNTARITQLLRASEDERERLDRIVTAASDGVVLLDADGDVQVWSPAAERITGCPAATAIGRPLQASLAEDRDTSHMPLAHLVRTSDEFEVDIVLPDRSRRSVRVAVTTTHDDDGQVTGHVVLLHDVTRERETERLKDDFLARVSHELRTPLTPIKGFAESLRAHPERVTPELLEMVLSRIEDRADHMTGLIDDLLLVASNDRLSAAADGLDPVLTMPVDVAEEAVAAAAARFPTRTVTVTGARRLRALSDPDAVAKIVEILTDNALRYSGEHDPVDVVIKQAGASVQITVRDRGRGIPADHLERVFDRFHRLEDPLRMTTGGLGIGLYIARRLATRIGAQLTAHSTVGVGSRFTLSLPAMAAAAPAVTEPALDPAPVHEREDEPAADPHRAGSLH